MSEGPATQAELAARLRELAAVRPTSRQELANLEGRCVALARFLATSATADVTTPEIVWHFLSDTGIRFKDSSYAEMQLTALSETLARWDAKSAV